MSEKQQPRESKKVPKWVTAGAVAGAAGLLGIGGAKVMDSNPKPEPAPATADTQKPKPTVSIDPNYKYPETTTTTEDPETQKAQAEFIRESGETAKMFGDRILSDYNAIPEKGQRVSQGHFRSRETYESGNSYKEKLISVVVMDSVSIVDPEGSVSTDSEYRITAEFGKDASGNLNPEDVRSVSIQASKFPPDVDGDGSRSGEDYYRFGLSQVTNLDKPGPTNEWVWSVGARVADGSMATVSMRSQKGGIEDPTGRFDGQGLQSFTDDASTVMYDAAAGQLVDIVPPSAGK